MPINSEQIDLFCMHIENDMDEECHRATIEERYRLEVIGACSTKPQFDCPGPNLSRCNPSHYNMIKLNVDMACIKGKASMIVLTCNYERDLMDFGIIIMNVPLC